MPVVDPNLSATWASWYAVDGPNGGTRLGYSRAAKERLLGDNHWKLLASLAIQKGQRIVLMGAGFGFVGEDWAAAGYGPIVNCDTSSWIQSNKTANATVAILSEGATTTASRRNIRTALGGTNVNPDWIITEDVLPTLSNAEVTTLVNALRQFAATTKIAHWVTIPYLLPSTFNGLNWKTLADWKTLVTPDLVVNRGTGEML